MGDLSECPAGFVKDLARHAQLLACVQWLSRFQLLACIPQENAVPLCSLAKLANVPEQDLRRVVRMAASAGFLCHPTSTTVAHSALSRHFVSKPSLLDAVTFLAETIVPAALRMADETELRKNPDRARVCAYDMGTVGSNSLASRCEQEPKLRRQSTAFDRLGSELLEEGIANALATLDWRSLGNAKIVEVGPRTPSSTLLSHQGLQIVLQVRDKPLPKGASHPDARVSLQYRALGAPQSIYDAAVYILHLPTPRISSLPSKSVAADILAELGAHFSMLRCNPNATLMLIMQTLPEPGTVDLDVEAAAHLQDLLLFQMTNKQTLEMSQLLQILEGIRDDAGRLVVVNKRTVRNSTAVILEVQIEDIPDEGSDDSLDSLFD